MQRLRDYVDSDLIKCYSAMTSLPGEARGGRKGYGWGDNFPLYRWERKANCIFESRRRGTFHRRGARVCVM